MSSLVFNCSKELDVDASGDTAAKLEWTFKNEGASDVRGLFRFVIVWTVGSENVRTITWNKKKAEVRKVRVGRETRLRIRPKRNKLVPGQEFTIWLTFKSPDFVSRFDSSETRLFLDTYKLGGFPKILDATIEGVHYPGFSIENSIDYECYVKLPVVKTKPWEEALMRKWSSGISNPSVKKEDSRNTIRYRFTLQPNYPKQFAVLYGKQPKGVPWLVKAVTIAFLAAAIAVAVLIAIGIVWFDVSPSLEAGGGIIVSLIGAEAAIRFLSWLSSRASPLESESSS